MKLPTTAQTFTAPTGFVFDDQKSFVTYAYYLPKGDVGNLTDIYIVADGKVVVT
ncbi:hypothetical protein [Streptomyces sp. TE33382]